MLALTALMGLVSTVLDLSSPWIFRELVNFLTSRELSSFFASIIPQDDALRVLIYLGVFYYGVELMTFAWRGLNFYYTSWVSLRSRIILTQRSLLKVHELSVGYFDETKPGVLRERLITGASEMYRMVRALLVETAPLIFGFIISIIVIGRFDIWLSIGLLLTSPLHILMSYFRTKWRKSREDKIRKMREEISSAIHDNLHYHNLIKEFSREEFERKRFKRLQEKEFEIEREQDRIEAWFRFLSPTIYTLSSLWVFGYGGYLVLQGQLQLGDLMLFSSYIGRIMGQLSGLLYLYDDIQIGLVSTKRYFEVIDYVDPIQDLPDAKDLRLNKGEVKFEDVDFTYHSLEKGAPRCVFKKLNLTIKPAESVALVGPSGVGKSTFVKLLMRFYDPQKGSIRIDGQDVKAVKQSSLRKHIATVMQDAMALNEEIGYNIRYGQPTAPWQKVRKAAGTANLLKFIEALPDKFKTIVGERGIKLSGGERQRLAIARAVLKDAQIVVLDEATSALDSENEKAIQDAMWKLIKGRTTIIIAHRLSTVRKVDRIIVFGKGGIVEEGSHKELMKKKDGYYRRLYKMQGDALLR